MRRPLTFREMLGVYLVCLAGLAVTLNRNLLPTWVRPEFYALEETLNAAHPWLAIPRPHRSPFVSTRVAITGHSCLVVGDSQAIKWPWCADVLGFAGGNAMQIFRRMRVELEHRQPQYAQIVVMVGTAHFQGGANVRTYVDGVAKMVALGRESGAEVFVVTPMPYDERQIERFLAAHPHIQGKGMRRDTLAHTTEAAAALRLRLPDVVMFDLGQFHAMLTGSGRREALYVDGLHLTPEGWSLLADELAAAGIQVTDF